MIELIIFDFNGTILADTQLLIDGNNYILQKHGVKPLNKQTYLSEFYFPTHKFFQDRIQDGYLIDKSEIGKMFFDYYSKHAHQCRTRKGTKDVLTYLDKNSIDKIVLSNHFESDIISQLQRLKLIDHFNAVIANSKLSDNQNGNNKIHRLEDYFSNTNYNVKNCVIVGDSPEDINIGKAFGMDTIAITDGSYSRDKLKASKPNYIITNLNQIIGILGNDFNVIEKYLNCD
jgi:phosphoglycolate phosphatase